MEKRLGKVYGPLYSILVISNNRAKTIEGQDTFLFEPNELYKIYKIFVEYAYLIPKKLREEWVDKVIKQDKFFKIKHAKEKGGVITINLHDLFSMVKEEYDKWNLEYKKMCS